MSMTVNIDGLEVSFPFEPYECQKSYMRSVITCLRQGVNGILESPTGTGKTLSLLCSSLSWLESQKAQVEMSKLTFTTKEIGSTFSKQLEQQLQEAAGLVWDTQNQTAFRGYPRIIYASRTHSQLTQAIQELKRTTYGKWVRSCILGSRDQLCIHSKVSTLDNNSAKIHVCRQMVKERNCWPYRNFDDRRQKTMDLVKDLCQSEKAGGVVDIEDLVKMGRKHLLCPFYMAKEGQNNADIVFMPYNYLLDPEARRSNKIDVAGCVIIFDEAHNLEQICEESASVELKASELAMAVNEVTEMLNHLMQQQRHEEILGVATEASTSDYSVDDLTLLKTLLLELESAIDTLELNPQTKTLKKSGEFMLELLRKVNVRSDNVPFILDLIDKIINDLTLGGVGHSRKGAGLSKVANLFKLIMILESRNSAAAASSAKHLPSTHYYRTFISLEQENSFLRKKPANPWETSSKLKRQGRTLHFWCFSAGSAMQDLVESGVHSIILTSGTLSPISSFKTEMRIPFPVELQNLHIIEKEQVFVSVVTKGPDGTNLSSSYANRSSVQYQKSLGNTIVNLSRIVPAGMLVFFPSYTVMNECFKTWQDCGIADNISRRKCIFVEPKGKDQFESAMSGFYEAIRNPDMNGAAFFAVCRGKVSEGLDFADINGRAVIITGLPYPPRMDSRVVMKMEFLEEQKRHLKTGCISGEQWYRLCATRAVNQAIGRVIRHRRDFGSIMLCDSRFQGHDIRQQLSKWVQPHVSVYEKFGCVLRDLTGFLTKAEEKFPYEGDYKKRIKVDKNEPGCQGASFLPSSSTHTVSATGKQVRRAREEAEFTNEDISSQYSGAKRVKSDHLETGLLALLDDNRPQTLDWDTTPLLTASEGQVTKRKRKKLHKKIKVVSHRQQNFNVGNFYQHAPTPEDNAKISVEDMHKNLLLSIEDEKQKKQNFCGKFLKQLEKSLGEAKWQRLKKDLALYKKQRNIDKFSFKLIRLVPHRSLELYQGLCAFLPTHHKPRMVDILYTEVYESFIPSLIELRTGCFSDRQMMFKRCLQNSQQQPSRLLLWKWISSVIEATRKNQCNVAELDFRIPANDLLHELLVKTKPWINDDQLSEVEDSIQTASDGGAKNITSDSVEAFVKNHEDLLENIDTCQINSNDDCACTPFREVETCKSNHKLLPPDNAIQLLEDQNILVTHVLTDPQDNGRALSEPSTPSKLQEACEDNASRLTDMDKICDHGKVTVSDNFSEPTSNSESHSLCQSAAIGSFVSESSIEVANNNDMKEILKTDCLQPTNTNCLVCECRQVKLPVMMKTCGHVCCKLCWHSYITKNKKKTCPACGLKLYKDSFKKLY